jgi:uncharacterized GH25 family protein
MRRLFPLVLFSVLLVVSAASASEIRIGGRVLLPGGTPLPNAEVTLSPIAGSFDEARAVMEQLPPEAAARTLTGESGRFELTAPHAGLWRLRVEAAGFVPLETKLRPLIEPLELPDAELTSDSGLTVKVTGEGGGVLSGATVIINSERSRFAFRSAVWGYPQRSGSTADDGSLRLPHAEKEKISLSVFAAGHSIHAARGLRGTSARVGLQTGEQQQIVVRSAEGRALPAAMAVLGKQDHPVGYTDAEGRLTLHLASSGEMPLALIAEDGRRLEMQIAPSTEQPREPLQISLPERLFISGRLIDADSRRAIAGGVVWDEGDSSEASIPDAAGGYVLGGPAGRRLFVTAGAPGYLNADSFDFRLNDDGRPGPTIALQPAAAIEGKVIDGNGGVAGAEIEVEIKRQPGAMVIEIGGRSTLPRAISGHDGSFRISPLDPENGYEIKVRAEGYAPASLDVAGLEPYRARTGLRIPLSRGQAVLGKVVDGDGRPIREATVELNAAPDTRSSHFMRIERGGSSEPIAGMTDDDGDFAIDGIPAGKFDLTASRTGFAKRKVPAIEIARDSEPVDVGEISLQVGEKIQGMVFDRDGQPVEGAEIFLEESGPMMGFVMAGGTEREATANSEASGWFMVEDLSPEERYTLRFQRTGFVEKSVGPIELPAIEPLEVTLDTASRITGRVVNAEGDPIAGSSVSLERTHTIEMGGAVMQAMMMTGADTDAEGRFLFEDQEPGKIKLSAVAPRFQEATLDHLEVPKGEDLDGVEIILKAGAVVEGRVLAPDGRPAIGTNVRLAGETPGMIRMGGAGVDGNGYYRLDGLEPGELSVEATHEDYPRVVKDIEAKEGINALNLRFEGGQEVAGMVASTSGEPIGQAVVRLVPAGRYWGGSEAVTDNDGSFSMAGVQEGSYQLRAEAEEFAPSTGDTQVEVAGEPVRGLEVLLDPGATIYGKISGLEPESFSKVGVRAEGSGYRGFQESGADYRGEYRLEHLPPGSYSVVATLSDSGSQAKEEVVVEQGVLEVRADLQFGTGLTLSGRVLRGEEPVHGATIFAEGIDNDDTGWSRTGQQGKFSIDGLEGGEYTVHVRNFQTGLGYNETVSLATSRKILLEVPTALVAGTVVGSFDKEPLPGVIVSLEAGGGSGLGLLPIHTATTDLNGRFEVESIADGDWRLSASKKGYAAISQQVVVQHEQDVDDLRLTMEATEGLTLEARLPSGAIPDELMIAVLDPAGGALVNGHYATGENGRVRLSSVPAGNWGLVISAAGAATVNLRAQAPGAVTPVALQPASSLRISVPELAGGVAAVTLRSADGGLYRSLSWSAQPRSEWRMTGDRIELTSLPPGSWEVAVASADGRSWRGSVVTNAGAMAELLLE